VSAAERHLGVDVVRISEFDRLGTRPWFRRFVYAECELAYADSVGPSRRREFLAGRFAAKEAALKVLRTGLFGPVPPRDIAVDRAADGAPVVRLTGAAAEAAALLDLAGLTVSISHKDDLAAAVAVAVPLARSAQTAAVASRTAHRAAAELCRMAAGADDTHARPGRN
jgi:holo-[acyl-carrier protein] synthase